MRRRLRLLAWALGALVLAAVIALVAFFAVLGSGDPVAAARAPLPAYGAQSLGTDRIEKGGAVRRYESWLLTAPDRLPVHFTVSLPEDGIAGRMPVLLIVGGLRSGRENLERLPPLGPNALISVEYPGRDAIRDKALAIPERIATIRRSATAMPEQLAAVLDWARAQAWADPGRVSLLGYSLGAVFMPVTQEKARANGIAVETTIMAFGGADVGHIIPTALRIETPLLRKVVGVLATSLLHPVEPRYFLPRMSGDILIVNAEDDELIPPTSSALMTELAPEPKWVVTMPGEHIDPRDPAMLQKVVDVTKAWLIERGAANPEQ
ncbi:MAG: hypothetical protein U1F33_12065 [Alphaproteobacteria bacterium]